MYVTIMMIFTQKINLNIIEYIIRRKVHEKIFGILNNIVKFLI